jgi:alpha-ketoglutarate-dependent taurine dioxygenase
MTCLPHPLEGISLHPQAVPRVSSSTTFVSNAVAWDALPPALQDELRGLRGCHRYKRSAELDLN